MDDQGSHAREDEATNKIFNGTSRLKKKRVKFQLKSLKVGERDSKVGVSLSRATERRRAESYCFGYGSLVG